ncbi:MAG: homoserine dehydrogenase [Synergistota bacterium]|nr:homoserine dehydrogenase [Synergistota bacterium]
MRALIIGFGNVGRTIARMLTTEISSFPALRRLDVKPVGIITRSRGSLVNAEGLDFEKALTDIENHGVFPDSNASCSTMTGQDAARTLDYDVLVELSTLNISSRGEPAAAHIRTALARGKHVVSANKGPVAFCYDEMKDLSKKHGGRFLFETTVMDGAPVFNLVRDTMKGCVVQSVDGIFNSTTNYILDRMEQGVPLEEAVREAQKIGVAEADPAHDLEGWDPAAKTAALANVIMEGSITPLDVERTGITGLDMAQVREAAAGGQKYKLICRAWRENGTVRASVKPEKVPLSHHYATVSGGGAVLRICTDVMGPILVTQEDPSLYDTAYGVLEDLLTLQLQ